MADLEDIELDQSERLVSVEHSPFGPKKLLIAAFECVEQLSTLPRCQLEIMTLGRALKPSEMLGQKLGFALQIRSQSRKFNGIVSGLQVVRSTVRDHFLHLVEVVPPAWILTLNQRCQLFHDKKATDIVAQVLQDGSVASQLKSSGAVREYTVQYCESDFNFISRLLEEEGLFYRFSYADANCPIVTGDAASDFIKMDPYTLDFAADIDRWQPQYQVVASTFKHAAWDFQAVDVIEGNANSLAKAQPPGLPARAFYDYSGRFATADAGKQLGRCAHGGAGIQRGGGLGQLHLRSHASRGQIQDQESHGRPAGCEFIHRYVCAGSSRASLARFRRHPVRGRERILQRFRLHARGFRVSSAALDAPASNPRPANRDGHGRSGLDGARKGQVPVVPR